MFSPKMLWNMALLGSLFLAILLEAGNAGVADLTKMLNEMNEDEPICISYGVFNIAARRTRKQGGYCNDIIGNQPIIATPKDMFYYDDSMWRWQYQAVSYRSWASLDISEGKKSDRLSEIDQCFKQIDDIYCHYYYKRCYIDSKPQPICREACEDLQFKHCKREFREALKMNFERRDRRIYQYHWDIINCTTLPYRNETTNCYYPNHDQEKVDVLETKDCFYGNGRGYRGNTNTTKWGKSCLSWDTHKPDKSKLNESIYDEIRNSSNFCRNPGGLSSRKPWCYFVDEGTVKWEYCNVPGCPKQPPSSPPNDYQGHNLSSTAVKVSWGNVPKPSRNGVLLGFHVLCERPNSTAKHFANIKSGSHSCEFKGLEKFTNYSCRLRAYNTFGNGTWSKKLVISTDEDVPSAAPESLEGWNISSTSLQVQWDPIPVGKRNGEILGYQVEARLEQQRMEWNSTVNYTTIRSIELGGLKKYSVYVVSVYGVTRRGRGPPGVLTVRTDEDVPDRPPSEITAKALEKDVVQLKWSPVSPKNTNGRVLGYRVFYSDVQNKSRANSTVAGPKETNLIINGLRPGTNYSFQMLAFTSKGNGAISASYFARTSLEPRQIANDYRSPSRTTGLGTGATVAASVVPGIFALGAVFLAIHFAKKRGFLAFNDRNNLIPTITPYATSPPDWIDRIIANRHGYETLDDENVPTTPRRHPYVNIAPDGSLNIPPFLREIVIEFEQAYENTRYKRLQRKRRSLEQIAGKDGKPKYDKLDRGLSYYNAFHQQNNDSLNVPPGFTTTEALRDNNNHSIDLSELREFMRASERDVCSKEMIKMGVAEHSYSTNFHRRRFSVDLGEVREFISLREMRIHSEDESTV